MRNLRGTYVHRGDAARRRRRIKQAVFVAASITGTIVVLVSRNTRPANAEPVVDGSRASIFSLGETRTLRRDLATAKGELNIMRAQFERADKIIQYSTKYAVPAGLAGKVFDASLREGIDPELAFRLVALESEFNEHAISKVGAIGLTQLMPSTAKLYQRGDHPRSAVQRGDECSNRVPLPSNPARHVQGKRQARAAGVQSR